MDICRCPFLNTEFAFICSLVKRWGITFAFEKKKKVMMLIKYTIAGPKLMSLHYPKVVNVQKRTIVLLKPRNFIVNNGIG